MPQTMCVLPSRAIRRDSKKAERTRLPPPPETTRRPRIPGETIPRPYRLPYVRQVNASSYWPPARTRPAPLDRRTNAARTRADVRPTDEYVRGKALLSMSGVRLENVLSAPPPGKHDGSAGRLDERRGMGTWPQRQRPLTARHESKGASPPQRGVPESALQGRRDLAILGL
jgi:hypothetical protein